MSADDRVTLKVNIDAYYVAILQLTAVRSTCRRRAVAAIIVDTRGRVLSTGYNGVPSTFKHCTEVGCLGVNDPSGDTRRCMAVHAEVNALLQCHRLDLAHTLYVSCVPCFECAKVLSNTDIKRVVALEPYPGLGSDVLVLRGIQVELYDTHRKN